MKHLFRAAGLAALTVFAANSAEAGPKNTLPPSGPAITARPMTVSPGEVLVAHFAACSENGMQTMARVTLTPLQTIPLEDALQPLVAAVSLGERELPLLHAATAETLATNGGVNHSQYLLTNGHYMRTVSSALRRHMDTHYGVRPWPFRIRIGQTVMTGQYGIDSDARAQDAFYHASSQSQTEAFARYGAIRPLRPFLIPVHAGEKTPATGTVYGILRAGVR